MKPNKILWKVTFSGKIKLFLLPDYKELDHQVNLNDTFNIISNKTFILQQPIKQKTKFAGMFTLQNQLTLRSYIFVEQLE